MSFGPDALKVDCESTSREIEDWIRRTTSQVLRRRGLVVGVSGGVDSAVCLALAARAVRPERVLALLLPERDFGEDGTTRAEDLCGRFGVEYLLEDIDPVLAALGCYRRRDEAIRKIVPAYDSDWRCKIAIAENLLEKDRINYFSLIAESPAGDRYRERMPLEVYLAVVAATNMKQRSRKLLEYHHAERLNYAVIGTPNRLEFELGFFVRGGDGLADLKPIAHLYKSQVYQLAAHLGIPEEIRNQPPSTDTYSLPQTQEEFYFALPYDRLDAVLFAYDHGVAAAEAGQSLGLSTDQVGRVYRDIKAKKSVAAGLDRSALRFGAEG